VIAFLWRVWFHWSRGYRFRPWRSPYLRWRIETFWGLHAEHITTGDFFRFAWQRRRDLIRFSNWAAHMPVKSGGNVREDWL
jgi:hypothetical protein